MTPADLAELKRKVHMRCGYVMSWEDQLAVIELAELGMGHATPEQLEQMSRDDQIEERSKHV